MLRPLLLAGLIAGLASGAAAACQSHGRALLDDDFRTPDIGWGKPDQTAAYGPAGLVLRPPAGSSAWRWNQNYALARADFCVEVANPATLPSPANEDTVGDVGIWFWAKDAQNFYTATIAPDGTAAVDRLVGGVWQKVVAPTPAPAINTAPGAVNEIELVTDGPAARLYVNGSRVADFRGTPPPGGGAPGVYGESGPSPTSWVFRRVRLY